MSIRLDACGIGPQVCNALIRNGVCTLGDLAARPRSEVAGYPNLGAGSLARLEDLLREHGLAFAAEAAVPRGRRVRPRSAGHVPLKQSLLSQRSANALLRAGYETLTDIASQTLGTIALVPSVGSKSLAEVQVILRQHGLEFADSGSRGDYHDTPAVHDLVTPEPAPAWPRDYRFDEMAILRRRGQTFDDIGACFGLSGQRVREILRGGGFR